VGGASSSRARAPVEIVKRHVKGYPRSNASPINNKAATITMMIPMGRGFETTLDFSLRRTRPADHHRCICASVLVLKPQTSPARTTPTAPNSTTAARATNFISRAYGVGTIEKDLSSCGLTMTRPLERSVPDIDVRRVYVGRCNVRTLPKFSQPGRHADGEAESHRDGDVRELDSDPVGHAQAAFSQANRAPVRAPGRRRPPCRRESGWPRPRPRG
jgi:hypothetical protein